MLRASLRANEVASEILSVVEIALDHLDPTNYLVAVLIPDESPGDESKRS